MLRHIARHGQNWIACIVLLVMTSILVGISRVRPFWYDELLTWYVSDLESFSRVQSALWEGIDGMPITYYFLVRCARLIPLDSHIQLRILSVAGFIFTLLGIYLFSRKRLSSEAALIGLLVAALGGFRYYATEARSYGILAGFLSLAAVCWQRVDEDRRWLVPFSLFLSLSIAMHYLAVLVLGCFIVSELVYTWANRRLRSTAWLALASTTVPFWLQLKTLLHFKSLFAKGFWSKASWISILRTWEEYSGISLYLAFAILFALATAAGLPALYALYRRRTPVAGFPLHESALIAGLLAYPGVLVVVARITAGGYVSRYACPLALGVGITAAGVAHNFFPKRTWSVLTAGLILALMLQSRVLWSDSAAMREDLNETFAHLQTIRTQNPELPLVVSQGFVFLQTCYYGPADLKSHVLGLADGKEAYRYVGSDSLDTANERLALFTRIRYHTASTLLATHRKFILYSTTANMDWFDRYLLDHHYKLRLTESTKSARLYLVEQ